MRLIGYDADFDLLRPDRPLELRLEAVPGWSVVAFDAVRAHGARADRGRAGPRVDRQGPRRRPRRRRRVGGRRRRVRGVLVSLGGDIATAGRAPDGGWRILIADDSATSPDGDGELIAIERGAVATSSTTVRRWHRPRASRCITSSTRGRACRRSRRGAPSRSSPRPRSTPTPRRPRRSSWATRRRTGCAPAGLPARLVANDGAITRLGGWPEPATTIEAGSGP